jgi:hypothetical protein
VNQTDSKISVDYRQPADGWRGFAFSSGLLIARARKRSGDLAVRVRTPTRNRLAAVLASKISDQVDHNQR